jgi:hypothetical protein
LWSAGVLFIAYVAVEPYMRRRWPWRIVSWNRLLAGRFRDPLVGHDVLIGCLIGTGDVVLNTVEGITCEALRLPCDVFFPRTELESLSLGRLPHFLLAAQMEHALQRGLTGFAIFFLLFLLFRGEWPAGVVALAWSAMFLSGPDYFHPVNISFVLVRCVVHLYLAVRFGLLAVVVGAYCWSILAFTPITYDLGAWYAGSAVVSLALVAGLAGYGFWTAKAGRPLFRAGFFEGE